MITSAGRLSSTISQGSPSLSAMRERPMASPIIEPSAMAMTNATATRASVAPRLTASAPERASSTMASATACGSGSRRSPARLEPAYQAAISSASEMSRAPKSLPRGRPVESAGRELARRADQLRAADFREHEVEGARVGLLVGERPAHDAFAVALAIDRERARIGGADAPREALPLPLRGGEQGPGAADGIEGAGDGPAGARGPSPRRGIADH